MIFVEWLLFLELNLFFLNLDPATFQFIHNTEWDHFQEKSYW